MFDHETFNNLKKHKMKNLNFTKIIDSLLYVLIAGLFTLALIAIGSMYWGMIIGKIKDVYF
jgi:hypothetical protein